MNVTRVNPVWPDGYIIVNIDDLVYIRYDHNDWMLQTPSGQERPIIDDATEHEIAFRAYIIQTQESASDDNY